VTDPASRMVSGDLMAGNTFTGPTAVQAGDHNTQNVTFAAPRAPVPWPHQVGVLPRQADCFQDRGAVAALDTAVAGGGTAVLCQVLSGTGGVGKTQLAAHYARRAWAAGNVDLVVWVTAATRAAVTDAYAQAGAEILGADLASPARAAQAFLAWLEPKGAAERHRWLIVLDDVADPADLRGLWPPSHSTGRTVVTTRRRDAALTGPGRCLVPVGLFTVAEAGDYLASSLAAHNRHEPREQIVGLAADLGLLPLALSQAAAYLVDADVSCAAYRRLLTDRATMLNDLLPDASALPDDQATTVAAAWSLSVARASRFSPQGVPRPLLQLIAMLDPNGIPASVLASEPVLAYLTAGRTSGGDIDYQTDKGRASGGAQDSVSPQEVTSALRVLHRLSLIDHTPANPYMAVRIHNLIQRALRDPLPPTEYNHLAIIAADALVAAWPPFARDTGLAQALRANASTLINHAEDALWQPSAHPVLFRSGESFGETGQVATAVAYYQRLAEASHDRLGPDHLDTLTARSNLAQWRGHAGDAAGAAMAAEEVLVGRLRVLGPDHPETLTTRYHIAHWNGQATDPAGAVAAIEQVLADRARVLGPDHPDTLTTRSNLAYWRGRAGDPSGAVAALDQLLEYRLQTLSPDHPDVLMIRYNLAYWLASTGDVTGATVAMEELLTQMLRILGPDHTDTLNARNAIACWHGFAGDQSRAIAELEELLADRLRVSGPDHRLTLVARHNLLRWRGETGDVSAAAEGFEQLLADRVRALGPDNPHTLNARGEIARWRGEAGDAAGAVAELEQLLADRLRILGPNDIDTLSSRHNLAYWRGHAGEVTSAAAELTKLLANRLRILGSDDPDTLTTRGTLAYWQGEAGDIAGAIAETQELLADLLRLFGPDNRLALTARHNLARWRGEAGDAAGAAAAFEELLADRLRLFGPDHPHTLSARSELAQWGGEAGDPAGAAAAFEELLADHLRVLGPDHPHTLATRRNLDHWRQRRIKPGQPG
jgi:tetratricopeptide (TPR) repeat protein